LTKWSDANELDDVGLPTLKPLLLIVHLILNFAVIL